MTCQHNFVKLGKLCIYADKVGTKEGLFSNPNLEVFEAYAAGLQYCDLINVYLCLDCGEVKIVADPWEALFKERKKE